MRSTFLGGLLSLVSLCAVARAESGVAGYETRWPFALASVESGGAALRLAPSAGDLAALASQRAVRFHAVPLPGGAPVDLQVNRFDVPTSADFLRVDGLAAPSTVDLSVWRGQVDGDPSSDVYLAFSSFGSRGWVRTQGETYHLLATPGRDDDWRASTSLFVSESELARLGSRFQGQCLSGTLGAPGSVQRSALPPPSGSLPTSATLVCRMAVETDYQLYQLFNDANAELVYTLSLFGAVSSRFYEQVNVVLELAYLGLYTNPNDPWWSGDAGAGLFNMLLEFTSRWQLTPLPNRAHLAHFLSGATLGGGIAWLNTLCDPTTSFAVSGDLVAQTPFPVTQGPLTWDFVVMAHEISHNFNAIHTHEYCPPLDECAPNGYFGTCQTTQVCSNQGSLMSYCHLCSGGLNNMSLYLHPRSVTDMRQAAEASCLGNFCSQPTTYCIGGPNSTGQLGVISALGSTSIAAANFTLQASGLPINTVGLFYYGRWQAPAPFGPGYRCIDGPSFRLRPASSSSSGLLQTTVDFTSGTAAVGPGAIDPGSVWNFQAWYRDPAAGGAGFNLSNALNVHFCP